MTVKSNYVAPRVVEIGRFRRVTNGVWFGRWRDIYGGRAFIRVEVG
ncbi:lasso RiPP family leader peptide-containing protein [Actinomyces wuliandei]|nr:lasso RiPP family leader peptide-containing protein [Actinomyces wuliandei]